MFQLYDVHGPIETINEETAVTIGVFDGVHRGHQALISQLTGFAPTVVTLTSHPSFVLGRRDSEYWLDDPEEHLRLLFGAGVRYVAMLPFTAELAGFSACQMTRILCSRLNMRSLLLGYDSRFGNREHDDFDRLPQLAEDMGFSLKHGEPFIYKGTPISSSRIRKALEAGIMDTVAELMGRPYSIGGTVKHGRNVGHTLGFPTANVDISQSRKTLPKEGVYAVRLKLDDKCLKGMANLGPQPTFGQRRSTLEVYIFDFEGDIYDRRLDVEFVAYLRDTKHFDSAEGLRNQLINDLKTCQTLL